MKTLFIRDTLYNIGLLLVFVSSLTYFLSLDISGDSVMGVFLLNHIFTVVYWICVIITGIVFRKNFKFYRIFPALVLSLISAYSLNREMNVFDASPSWFTVLLIIISITYLSLAYYNRMPRLLRYIVLLIVGIGSVVFLYQAIYLLPLYPFSALFFWILGIPLNSFGPLLFLIFTIVWLVRFIHIDKKALSSWGVGVAIAIIPVVIFTIRWTNTVNRINDTYQDTFVEDHVALPAWIRVAQVIPANSITNKILKVNLTYMVPDLNSADFFDFNLPSRFTEKKIHDPFIVIASFFSGKVDLTVNEKIKILESIYDSRHQATERLWSDEGLETSYINSSIQIWPQFRIAYTEQIITVKNMRNTWSRGEAVYTFHLPEGSVVTSLSLWINGIEEKAIMTTKEKADSAYRTIVGVEARDPSLVTWKEGLTVNVRVFPVTFHENRTFKLGITSPLNKNGQYLEYAPIYFDGTDFTKAKETVNVQFMQEPQNLHYPSFLKQTSSGLQSHSKNRYENDWHITLKDTGLSSDAFSFGGYCYTVGDIHTESIPVNIQNIYLDLNRSWTKEEYETLCRMVQNKKIRAFNGQKIVDITAANQHLVFDELKDAQFSLFPLHKITNPATSILVSKSTPLSPNLSDLKDSPFLAALKSYAGKQEPVMFYNLGANLSPYLKTLREYRLIEYQQGSLSQFDEIIQKSVFPQKGIENRSLAVINDAGIMIQKNECKEEKRTTAPDHLMRLFSYNRIMQLYAKSWNTDEPLTDELVAIAKQAYVVSPVSSLVVLETKRDYERFDIKDTDNSLKNASKSSNGAVPEPHEWILLILGVVIAAGLFIRKRL